MKAPAPTYREQRPLSAAPWIAAQEEMANALGAKPLKEFRGLLDGSTESLRSYG
jgi:hypothetical protein